MKSLLFMTLFLLAGLFAVGCGGGFDNSNAPELFSVASLSPKASPVTGNIALTITGAKFQTGIAVQIDGTDCSELVLLASTELTCLVPAHAEGVVDVLVTNGDNASVTLAQGFTYVSDPAPLVSSILPSSGSALGGTSVTLSGADFRERPTVKIGGVACVDVVVNSPTSLTCNTGEHPFTSAPTNVTVTNSDGTQGTLSTGYTYDSTGTERYSVINADILQPKCASCHGSSGGYSVASHASTVTRVSSSFDPNTSTLYNRVSDGSMPQGGPALSASELAQIRSWILGGAQDN